MHLRTLGSADYIAGLIGFVDVIREKYMQILFISEISEI
jgi:hypothetical protein